MNTLRHLQLNLSGEMPLNFVLELMTAWGKQFREKKLVRKSADRGQCGAVLLAENNHNTNSQLHYRQQRQFLD